MVGKRDLKMDTSGKHKSMRMFVSSVHAHQNGSNHDPYKTLSTMQPASLKVLRYKVTRGPEWKL